MPASGVTVVVGPNNSGKSQLLREFYSLLSSKHPNTVKTMLTLSDLEVRRGGNADELVQWLESHGSVRKRHPEGNETIAIPGIGQQPLSEVVRAWSSDDGLGVLASSVVALQLADQRLSLSSGTSQHNFRTDVPSNPIQRMLVDESLEKRLSDLTRRAFGYDVSLNRYVQQLELRIGRPKLPLTPPPAPRALLDEWDALPTLATQGDGVRAFAGLLLHVLLADVPVMLIDEPEAFLHPPQARLLGQTLVEASPPACQLIVATHSSDILQGVLGARGREIKIIRLDRQGGVPVMRHLEPSAVAQLWSDPLVRYSNLLDGIFHQGSVICEGDDDCRFYSAILDTLVGQERYHDLQFTHVSGKGRLAKAMTSVKQFGVRSAVVADFDILENPSQLRSLGESAGLDWDLVSADYATVQNDVAGRWQPLRDSGLHGIPQAAAQIAARRLMARFREAGVFVVPVGELERRVPTASSKRWLVEVLEGGEHERPSPELSEFVGGIAKFFDLSLAVPQPAASTSSANTF